MGKLKITCKGCGACCQHVGFPLGYMAIIDSKAGYGLCPEDAERIAALPEEAKEIYVHAKAAVERGEHDDNGPCCWLDPVTRACRWYEYRPQVCREFEIGSWDCIRIRKRYGPPTVAGRRREAGATFK